MKSDNNPLRGHGDADNFPTLAEEDFGGPHEPPIDERTAYYQDQNHADSRCIFCWVIIAALALALVIVVSHGCK
jgi:hypothetical protein